MHLDHAALFFYFLTEKLTPKEKSALVETLGNTLTFTDPLDVAYTVASPAKPLLLANSRYWVVVVPFGSGTFVWRNSNLAAFTTEVGASLPSAVMM